ncbi:MAG: AAA family ATPase [Caldisericia bacterium]|nr:AAA family ATPase [Caldisericia bacterium]
MKLLSFKIEHFRSIENIEIKFPDNKPIVLFGPNNVGKSNILKALDIILGERYAGTMDFPESDFFQRDKESYKNISFTAKFDECIKYNNKILCFTTNHKDNENMYHKDKLEDTNESKFYLSNEDKEKCQFLLIDATRDISRQLSYINQFTILSKMAQKMHKALVRQTKSELKDQFDKIKKIFEGVDKYKKFLDNLKLSFDGCIDGFEHKLEIDLSAYDPNNYFHSLKIVANDGQSTRSFDEFGTGEQQILLMSFVKAYAHTFKGSNFVLGIEEPEAHLHPLAQKWLAKNINTIAESGIQVIISTHSPEFLDIENLEGFVKVYKENNITKIVQFDSENLANKCIEQGVVKEKCTKDTILQFYKSNTFYDQLKGFFARKILLVEGETELFSLPNYFKNCGYDLTKEGVEIVNCRGKNQLARNYRLFNAYGYNCFCLFDGDDKAQNNNELSELFEFDKDKMSKKPEDCFVDETKKYGYFGLAFENYMKSSFNDYEEKNQKFAEIYISKPLIAKLISEKNPQYKPGFIYKIAKSLDLKNIAEQTN